MLFLLPTDTCYGLAGAFTELDYHEIYRLKGRDFSKPLALLVEDFDDMKKYIEISDDQIEFLKKYPHPWSFLGKRICDLPDWMDSEKYQMLSIRVEKVCLKSSPTEKGESGGGTQRGIHNSALQEHFQDLLCESMGVTHPNLPLSGKGGSQIHYPLFLTSANLSGQRESKTLAEAKAIFPGVDGIDGDICDRPPSDIFSIGEDGELQYLRRNY